MGWRYASCSAAETYANAGAPGPPLRYLYPQPTARSTPQASSVVGSTPAEWQRSHSISAPASWTRSVIAGISASAPER